MSVFFAGAMAALVVPRAVPPTEVPVPIVAPRDVDAVVARDRARAVAARAERAPAVALVGATFREVGRAEHAGDPAILSDTLRRLAEAKEAALRLGDQVLLDLRSYQAESFIAATEVYASSGDDGGFIELGGSLFTTMRDNGWLDESTHRVHADAFERRAMFDARYASVVGLAGPAFALTPVEHRALLRLCIRLPALPKGGTRGDPSTRIFSDGWLLARLAEAEGDVPEYPFALARGILHYRTQRYQEAQRELGDATARNGGPYALRAFNHLRAAFAAQMLE